MIVGVMVSEARERAGIIKTVLVVAQAIQTLQPVVSTSSLNQESQIVVSNKSLKKIIGQLPR